MCYEYEIKYSCNDKYCNTRLFAYSTYCWTYKLDGVNGRCGFVESGGSRQLSYPCRDCNLMSHPNPAIVQLRIRRNGTHLWVNYPNVGVDEHADAQSIEALKKRWMQWPELYQVPSGLPYHVDTWREEDWLLYFKKQEEEETVVSKEVTVGLSKEAQPVEKYKERDVCDLERYPGMLI